MITFLNILVIGCCLAIIAFVASFLANLVKQIWKHL